MRQPFRGTQHDGFSVTSRAGEDGDFTYTVSMDEVWSLRSQNIQRDDDEAEGELHSLP